jgi:hypothetical protein
MLQRGAILVLGSMRDGVATLVPAPSTTDHAVARISPYGLARLAGSAKDVSVYTRHIPPSEDSPSLAIPVRRAHRRYRLLERLRLGRIWLSAL